MKQFFLIALAAIFFMSCSNNTGTTSDENSAADSTMKDNKEAKEERNKEVALASARAFGNGGSADDILKDIDKDAVDYGTGEGRSVKGIDSIKASLKMWMAAFPDYKGSDFIAVADGDYVMVYGVWTGTWKNELMGQKPTGKAFKLKDVDIFKFNDAGKIVEHRAVQSMYELTRQTGMKIPEKKN